MVEKIKMAQEAPKAFEKVLELMHEAMRENIEEATESSRKMLKAESVTQLLEIQTGCMQKLMQRNFQTMQRVQEVSRDSVGKAFNMDVCKNGMEMMKPFFDMCRAFKPTATSES